MMKRERSQFLHAPLGERPMVLLSDAHGAAGLTLSLVPSGNAFVGLLSAGAQLTERLRLGLVPSLAVTAADGTRLVGEARVTLRGRPDAIDAPSAVRALLDLDPFGSRDAIVIEVEPLALHPDADVDGPAGTQPRT